jgi:hypothetical protein
VENAARLDLNLVQHGLTMWKTIEATGPQLMAALDRLTCPVLLMKSGMWPTPGAPIRVQEEPSDQPNLRAVRFVNAGHLVPQEAFDDFVRLTQEFLQRSH